MIFCGNVGVERLIVHPLEDPSGSHYIDVVMDKDIPAFYVNCSDYDEWSWDFWYNRTDYEIVKHLIMECIIECDTMKELIEALDDTFNENCRDMVFDESEIECDGDCDDCEIYEC